MTPPPPPRPLFVRLLPAAAFTLFSAWLLVWLSLGAFVRNGDGWEYYVTLEAFSRHATPDIQEEDFQATVARLGLSAEEAAGFNYQMRLPHGYMVSKGGKVYALHFWTYPLGCVPAKFALRAIGGSEINALRVGNGMFFLLGLGAVLFGAKGPWKRRLVLAGLVCVNPVVWYLSFTGAEVFSWGLTAVCVVCLDRERYAGASLAAGLAATQNPPLVLLAGVGVLLALARRRWWKAGLAALGAAVAFLPAGFYLLHFGKPSLIGEGYVNPKLISLPRTLSLLFDLNAGLLPYVPGLVLAVPVAAWRLAWSRHLAGLLVLLAVVGMLLAVQVQVNWNSDCKGMMRYLVWMLPPLAWAVAEGLPPRWLVAVGGVATLAAGLVLKFDPPTEDNYREHRPLARWVMTVAPPLYNPLPEIFIERQAHWEDGIALEVTPDLAADRRVVLPLAFGRTNGEVTKILVHRESAARLTSRYVIDPAYLPALLAEAEAKEKPGYVHPPKGAVRAQPWTVHGTFPINDDPWPFTGRGEDPWVTSQGASDGEKAK